MPSYDAVFKRGDTFRPLDAVLSDTDGVIDLTVATQVEVLLRSATRLVHGICEVLDPVAGSVRYEWADGDTDYADEYQVEWEITWPGGKLDTVPNDSYKTVLIAEDLDEDVA